MSNIEIIKGVALPAPNRLGGRKNFYPWDDPKFEVGDHFVFPNKIKPTTAQSLSYRAAKVTGRGFAIRINGDTIKCWRVK